MKGPIVLSIAGAFFCTFCLSMVTWNWDAQGGCLIFPIGLAYLAFWFVPLMSYVFPKGDEAEEMTDAEWSFRKRMGWGAFLGCMAMVAWALTLPSPIQRKEDLRCYQQVLPYQKQPGCR